MRALNTSHSARLAIVVACLVKSALALDPTLVISQYVHDRWGVDQGFPRGPVYAIAQTTDGYLWIGTEAGLVRFDGRTFRLIKDNAGAFTITGVRGLAADNSGGLWIRLYDRSIVRYRQGKFENPVPKPGSSKNVYMINRNANGEIILAQLVDPIPGKAPGMIVPLVYRNGTFQRQAEGSRSMRSAVISFIESPDGAFWMGTREAGLIHFVNGQMSILRKTVPDLKVNCLLSVERSELWVGTDNGITRWNGSDLSREEIPASLGHLQALAMLKDRDGNIWIGTGSDGLLRVNTKGTAALHLDQGVSHEAVTAMLEDREGNLWIGGADGIERLGDGAFVTYSMTEGLPAGGSNPLLVDAEGRLWFPPQTGGLWWAKDGRNGKITLDGLDRDLVYSLAGGNGELWIGRQRGGLTKLILGDGSVVTKTYTKADGLAQNSVYSVYRARDGTVWAGTLSAGVSALRENKFTNYSVGQGLACSTVVSILEDSDGTMWFATPSGLSSFSKGRWTSYGNADGLPSENINCLLQDSTGALWAGTASGLAVLSGATFRVPDNVPAELRAQILGIAEDRYGWLWIATSSHVLRVNRDKLRRGAVREGDLRDYGISDGLRGTQGVKRHQSVFADSAGRIWFSLDHGISVVDPTRLARHAATPIVHVEGLLVDDRAVDVSRAVHVSAGHRRITFNFAGLSFAAPDRLRYQYLLEHNDRDWSVPNVSGEASYTNLRPGSYRFRVRAANADGVFDPNEDVLDLIVDPLFWESWWFIAACIVAFVLATAGLYRMRLHFVTRRLHSQFEQRLAERIQVAQDFHDTLLQTIQGSKMVADDALTGPNDQIRLRAALERLSGWLNRAVQEGRVALNSLRNSTTEQNDLAEALRRAGEECRMQRPMEFDLVIEGDSWEMHPIVRDEIYRIAYEAIRNACTHSGGDHLVVELAYQDDLILRVCDNGKGISPSVAVTGMEGHFGIIGMHERAAKLRGKLTITSLPASGTKVELVLPRRFALLRTKAVEGGGHTSEPE